jgi:uncharacterized protein with NAD-binding domain and iron-sulfur cluster
VFEGAMKIIRNLDKISFKEWFLNHGGSLRSLERMLLLIMLLIISLLVIGVTVVL